MEFKDKFIAYIDVLGFKQLVEAAEAGTGMTLAELVALVGKLGTTTDRARFRNGPMVCPCSRSVQRDLDFQVTQISDCVILSAEVSPAGVINLVERAWLGVTEMLVQGQLCRGYVTRGKVFHSENQIIGTGYQKAYANEREVTAFRRSADERGTPFVEIDKLVVDYIASEGDACVKEMFSRFVKGDSTVMALYPFQRFASQFIIDKHFDAQRQRGSNQNLRTWLRAMRDKIAKSVDPKNESAARKVEHYLRALDAQLEVCDRTDHMITALQQPFPRR